MIKLYSFILLSFLITSPAYSHRYDKLEGVVLVYSDFLVEAVKRIEQRQQGHMNAREIDRHVDRANLEHCKREQAKVDALFQKINDLIEGKESLDSFLCEKLGSRLQKLQKTTDILLERFDSLANGNYDGAAIPVITDSDFFNEMMTVRKEGVTALGEELNKENRRIEITQWEFEQLVIKHTFQLMTLEELSPSTKKLLQLSPQLWDILQFKTYDLGVPDQCGAYGPLIHVRKMFMGGKNHQIRELLRNSEQVFSASASLYRNRVLETQSFEKAPTSVVGGTCSKAYALFMQKCDSELYRASKTMFFYKVPDLMLGGKGKYFGIWRSQLEADTWGTDILQYLNFIFGAPKASHLTEGSTTFSESMAPFKTGVSSPDVPPKKSQNTLQSKDIDKADLPKEKAVAVNPRVEKVKELAKAADSADSAEARTPVIMPTPPQPAATEVPVLATAAPRFQGFVYPNGLRKLHKSLIEQVKGFRDIPGDIRDFMDKLDSPRGGVVTFKEFHKYWASIGGSVEGYHNGGSHRQLIAPDGQPLWGIYDHGGFGKDTKRYLLSAFVWWAGQG